MSIDRTPNTQSILCNKWASTVASIWIQSTSGTPSTFGIYSSVLKSTQSYTQSTLDTVALFKDIGANFGVLAGLLYSSATASPRRPGPKAVILAGAAQCFLGYFLIWLVVVGVIDTPPVWVVCAFMFIAGHSMPFLNTADVVTAVNNLPGFSGTAVGIMKAFLGLSSAFLIQVYRTLFTGRQTQFLLLVSILSTLNPLWLMWFVRIYPAATTTNANLKDERRHLNAISAVILVMAGYLIAVIVLETVITLPLWTHILILIVLLLILATPLLVAVRAVRTQQQQQQELEEEETGLNSGYQRLPSSGNENNDGAEEEAISGAVLQTHPVSDEEEEPNLNLLRAIRTPNFWLLFFSTACALGSGLATLNNLTQIGESLGYTTTETATLVSLWSIWNSLGRFGAGYLSDLILHLKRWPRPLFMACTLVAMSFGHVIIATGLPGALYLGSVLVGLCYGSQLSLMPTITAEIFGVVNMGTIFNTITIAGPIGSYVLSVRVVGYIYDREVSGDGNDCTGVRCFMLSFFIMAGVTLFGAGFALVLFWRTKAFYQRVVYERIRFAGGKR